MVTGLLLLPMDLLPMDLPPMNLPPMDLLLPMNLLPMDLLPMDLLAMDLLPMDLLPLPMGTREGVAEPDDRSATGKHRKGRSANPTSRIIPLSTREWTPGNSCF
jgi:hypothetical protein